MLAAVNTGAGQWSDLEFGEGRARRTCYVVLIMLREGGKASDPQLRRKLCVREGRERQPALFHLRTLSDKVCGTCLIEVLQE